MKQFTCTEEKGLKFTRDDTKEFAQMSEGDSLTLPDAQVERFCKNGWGTAEGVETGERKPGVVKLDIEKSTQDGISKNA